MDPMRGFEGGCENSPGHHNRLVDSMYHASMTSVHLETLRSQEPRSHRVLLSAQHLGVLKWCSGIPRPNPYSHGEATSAWFKPEFEAWC